MANLQHLDFTNENNQTELVSLDDVRRVLSQDGKAVLKLNGGDLVKTRDTVATVKGKIDTLRTEVINAISGG